MPSKTTGSNLAAWLIIAAILGFAGGGFVGVQTSETNPTAGADRPADDGTAGGDDSSSPTPTEPPETTDSGPAITFEVSSEDVTTTDRVTFTGTLTPGLGGVELVLWRSVDGGEWTIFPSADDPVDPFVTIGDGSYDDYVQNLRAGDNTFKLVHADDPSIESEEVTVTVTE